LPAAWLLDCASLVAPWSLDPLVARDSEAAANLPPETAADWSATKTLTILRTGYTLI